MYADFFLDRLCEAAPVLKVFKQGLEAIDDDWINLAKDKLDCFEYIKDVFEELYHNFDDIELQYIANAIYAQAGAKESIEYLNDICMPYMHITISERLQPNGRFYDIRIDYLQTEYVKNYQLFKQKLESLIKDLLWYNDVSVGMYSIFFECHILNKTYLSEQVHVTNDKYAFFPGNLTSDDYDHSLFVVKDLSE